MAQHTDPSAPDYFPGKIERPRKPVTRKGYFGCRVTEDELTELKRRAKAAGYRKFSDWVRVSLFVAATPPKVTEDSGPLPSPEMEAVRA